MCVCVCVCAYGRIRGGGGVGSGKWPAPARALSDPDGEPKPRCGASRSPYAASGGASRSPDAAREQRGCLRRDDSFNLVHGHQSAAPASGKIACDRQGSG